MTKPKTPLPYGTYGILKSTVERFVETTTPTSLDRRLLHGLSGGEFSALMAALRFLGLAEENRMVKQEFRDLVDAKRKGDEPYKKLLVLTVSKAYGPVIGNFDIQAGTLSELEKVFRDASGYTGQMLSKAIRFWVKALEDGGVKVSEHVTKARPRIPKSTNGKAPKRERRTGGRRYPTPNTLSRDDNVPPSYQRLPIPGLGEAFIQYPADITEDDCKVFDAAIGLLRTLAAIREETGKKEKKP